MFDLELTQGIAFKHVMSVIKDIMDEVAFDVTANGIEMRSLVRRPPHDFEGLLSQRPRLPAATTGGQQEDYQRVYLEDHAVSRLPANPHSPRASSTDASQEILAKVLHIHVVAPARTR